MRGDFDAMIGFGEYREIFPAREIWLTAIVADHVSSESEGAKRRRETAAGESVVDRRPEAEKRSPSRRRAP
jgi:hypothetical protein